MVVQQFKAVQILLLVVFTSLCPVYANTAAFEPLPDLYKLDNYLECMNRTLDAENNYPAKYCMIFIQIQPDYESPLWHQIVEISNRSKLYFRHDNLFRGLCLENCVNFKGIEENSSTNVDNGLLNNEETEMFLHTYKTSLDRFMREKYHAAIHECIKQEYLEKYGLNTKTFIVYCTNPQQPKQKDIFFYVTILVIITLLVLCLFSSLYDAKLKSQQTKPEKGETFYEIKLTSKVQRYLTAFSLYRNYKRLMATNKSDISMDLNFLDGFRSVLCILILVEHIYLIFFGQIINSEFVETLFNSIWGKLFQMSIVWLELFFLLSGLMLYVKFNKIQYITTKSTFRDCVDVFVRLIVSRYLRFLPSLVFLILFTSNVIYYSEDGPFTRFLVDAVCMKCRENWWQNIFMINNYYIKTTCWLHSWYLCADLQLYAFYLIILIITAKYPRSTKYLFIGLAILSAAINVSVNYYLKLAPMFFLLPESYRYFFLQKIETGKYLYFSAYSNMNSFLLGIICGYVYMRYLRKNPENKIKLDKVLKVIPNIGWPMIMAIIYLGTTIMLSEETSLWSSMYGLLQRHVALTLVAIIVVLRGMCTSEGFLTSSIHRLLARLSFQVYLWQMPVLTYTFCLWNDPIYMSFFIMIWIFWFVFITSIVVAFIVALVVEYPFAEVISICDIEKKIRPTYAS